MEVRSRGVAPTRASRVRAIMSAGAPLSQAAETERMKQNRDTGHEGFLSTLGSELPVDRALPERRAGVVVAGRYRLTYLLGEGGMGTVWAAERLDGEGKVALKFLRGAAVFQPQARRRMMREARAAGAIRHPNVVKVHDILEDAGAPVLVMDLLEGESLRKHLADKGALPLGEVAHLLIPVLSAVGTAHAAGIIHRDIKPDNIFLTYLPGGGCHVKVLDFGLAKLTASEGVALASGELSRSGDLLGTPSYMSPEQAFGERVVDHRTDVWALGVVLYECLAGKRPFPGENVGQILKRIMTCDYTPLATAVPGLPEDVGQIVGRMLAADCAARVSDLAEVVTVLERYAQVEAPRFGAARVPASDDVDPFGRTVASQRVPRSRLWVALGILALAVGGAMFAKGLRAPAQSTVRVPALPNSTPPPVAPLQPVVSPVPAPAPPVAATSTPPPVQMQPSERPAPSPPAPQVETRRADTSAPSPKPKPSRPKPVKSRPIQRFNEL